ncbi:hypothetical protein JHK82_030248 [Glycine max]|nr:hypothetical protein JHK85_030879 [Glycine max]KAG4993515.1 hypothetical protein JHK86_030342 [Glycine max]KAG5123511.1 hypothetical protein JHK82_030248 [Glycine max]KAG5144935.1 hypothetical protein JHK84_030478 [Glycine max]
MANVSSFLFVDIRFDRKKFGVDIASAVKDEAEKTIEPLEEEKVAVSTTKKRKRKGTSSETVEGFNVFRSSTSVVQSNDEVRVIEESVV